MRERIAVAVVVSAALSLGLSGQTAKPSSPWSVARTPDGRPAVACPFDSGNRVWVGLQQCAPLHSQLSRPLWRIATALSLPAARKCYAGAHSRERSIHASRERGDRTQRLRRSASQ